MMWRNHYLTIGPLMAVLCRDPKGWPWALFAVWRGAPRNDTVLIDWKRKEPT